VIKPIKAAPDWHDKLQMYRTPFTMLIFGYEEKISDHIPE